MVAARELKEGIIGTKERDMWLWVDVFGMAFIKQRDLTVRVAVPYQWIASWAIDNDLFKVQLVNRNGKAKMHTFATGYTRAVQLKDGLWNFVNLYLKHPKAVKTLAKMSAPLEEGALLEAGLFASVPPLDATDFSHPEELSSKTQRSLTKGTPRTPATPYSPGSPAVDSVPATEGRAIREALARSNQERNALQAQVADLTSKLEGAQAGGAGGPSDRERELEGTLKAFEAENNRLRAREGTLDREIETLKASLAGSGEGAEANEKLVLLEENEKLMSLLEDQHLLLDEQVKAVGTVQQELDDVKEQLEEAKRARQTTEAVADAAVRDAQQAIAQAQASSLGIAHQHKERARENLRILNEKIGHVKLDMKQLSTEAESIKTAIPLMSAFCMNQLQEFLASGAFGSLKDAVARYKKECRLRKVLYNQLMELKGNIRVYCRVRPISAVEAEAGGDCVRYPVDDEVTLITDRAPKTFEFDKVFDGDTTQTQVFEDTAPLIASVLDGYTVCIFAYGQTGSGKTHTMEGPAGDPGVNTRAIQELFRIAAERHADYSVEISASVLEIYNEAIHDLLVPRNNDKLEVKHTPDGAVYVPGLTSHGVGAPEEIETVMDLARQHRSTFSTNMNEYSSRSHMMLSVFVVATNKTTGVKYRGKLHLVDLAGSERVSKSEVSGVRLKEAQNINKSLSSLGDVIHALSKKQAHVPYRNSKLTYVLQDSLGGDSKVLMFVQISPAEVNVSESMCSLNFAQRARSVELGKVAQNKSGGEGGGRGRPQSARPTRR